MVIVILGRAKVGTIKVGFAVAHLTVVHGNPVANMHLLHFVLLALLARRANVKNVAGKTEGNPEQLRSNERP